MELLYEMKIYGKPCSANAMYPVSGKEQFATGKRWKYLSPEGRAWKEKIKESCPMLYETINYPIRIEYHFTFKDARNRDIANHEKAITDSLVEYGLLVDDNVKIIQQMYITGTINKSLADHETIIKIYKIGE